MTTKNFEKISEDKKQMIINKGIKIFSEFSFVEAKTDLIVKEAGISKGLLFYYFDNKHSDDEALREHFESISALFSKRIKIENHNLKNPLVKLKNTKDLFAAWTLRR